MYYLWGSVHRIVCLGYMWESSMEVFMNKIKLVCTISIITIIGGTLFGCNNQSSKQTVNDTSNSMISDSDSSKIYQE